MGYYIEVEQPLDKAKQIIDLYNGEMVKRPLPSFDQIPE